MRLTAERTKRVDIPNDPDGAYVIMRNLSLEEVARIEQDHMIITDKEVRTAKFVDRDGNFARECLKDWGNFFDESGKEMKFTQRNIEKAAALSIRIDERAVRFFSWVNEEREKFAEEIEKEEESARKNS